MCGYGSGRISVRVLGAGAGPQKGKGSQTPLSGHTAAHPAGFGLRPDHHGPHRPFRQDALAGALKKPLGFLRDHPPHATTISRTLAGVPYEQLQGALTGWVARVVADQELNASVDGKWAKQSEDSHGNPLVMVNVLAHDLSCAWLSGRRRRSGTNPGCWESNWAGCSRTIPGCGC